MTNWSELPSDILIKIALDYYLSAADIISVSAVCHGWREVSSYLRDQWSPVIPWIMLSLITDDNKHSHECMHRLSDPLVLGSYQFSLPETLGRRRCFGSPYGWLFTIGFNFKICLFNPLTKSCLSLPPQWTLPLHPKLLILNDIRKRSPYYVHKGIVLKVSDQGKESLIVMVVYGSMRSLAFARPGDSSWTRVLTIDVCDVIYSKGKFLILHYINLLVACFDYADSLKGCAVDPEFIKCSIRSTIPIRNRIPRGPAHTQGYLLEADDGHVYLIVRKSDAYTENTSDSDYDELCEDQLYEDDEVYEDYEEDELYEDDEEDEMEEDDEEDEMEEDDEIKDEMEEDDEIKDEMEEEGNYRTKYFMVYRLETRGEKRAWKKINDLGRMTLFVGNSSVMQAPITHQRVALKFKSNAIYIVDDVVEVKVDDRTTMIKGGSLDVGIYEMSTKKVVESPYYDKPVNISGLCYPLFFKPYLSDIGL